MKNKVMYLLPLMLALTTGCIRNASNPNYDPSNYPYPLGIFTGKFTRIHKSYYPLKYDTATAALKLVLSTSTGFAITGDTSTVHAGSYGSFSENASYMGFNDATYYPAAWPAKTHLSGVYMYTYDGLDLNFSNSVADTLWNNYTFVKISN